MYILMFAVCIFLFNVNDTSGKSGKTDSESNFLEISNRDRELSVFIDCKTGGCDFDFFRREITFINYVRNRQDADIHVLVTSQGSGSGGETYLIDFIGLNEFINRDLSLIYESGPMATSDDIRTGLMQRIKTGILPFIVNLPVYNRIDISYEDIAEIDVTPVHDPWNLWVFKISLDFDIEREQQAGEREFEIELEANRTSENWKIDLELEMEYEQELYEIDDETITDIQHEHDLDAIVVKSLNNHWSVGGFSMIGRSTFENYDLRAEIAPAIEYNLFPYTVSNRQQLLFMYRAGINRYHYQEETIYDQTSESLFSHALNIAFEVNQPWGEIRTSVEGSNYLHDFTKNRVEINSNIEVNIFRGFAISLSAEYNMIRDQLNLRKGDASRDDILLQRRELATDFDYEFSIGFSYTFGALTNNIVNPRFGI